MLHIRLSFRGVKAFLLPAFSEVFCKVENDFIPKNGKDSVATSFPLCLSSPFVLKLKRKFF
jgi:hypothetical protein